MDNKLSRSQQLLLINHIFNITNECRFKMFQLKLSSDESDFPFKSLDQFITDTYYQLQNLLDEIHECILDLTYRYHRQGDVPSNSSTDEQ